MHEHLRWRRGEQLLSWTQTLEAMCAYYGTFEGRWHSNAFWRMTKIQIPNMTDQQCRDKVIQIESEAAADLAYWQAYQ